MRDQVAVGIDTGGTRTTVTARLVNTNRSIPPCETLEALSGSLASSQYVSTLRRVLAPLEARWGSLGVSDADVAVFISSAGFAPSTSEDFMDALMEVIPEALGGAIKVCGVANDTASLLLGHDAHAAVIAGTGSNVMARGADGRIHQIAGHGWAACDYGSGFWIGLRGIRTAYRDYESGQNSGLLQRLLETYLVRAQTDAALERKLIARLREFSVADDNMKPEIAKFARSICEAAARGDTIAQDIVKAEAEDWPT